MEKNAHMGIRGANFGRWILRRIGTQQHNWGTPAAQSLTFLFNAYVKPPLTNLKALMPYCLSTI